MTDFLGGAIMVEGGRPGEKGDKGDTGSNGLYDPPETLGVPSFVGSFAPPNPAAVAGSTKTQHLFGFPQLEQGSARSGLIKLSGTGIGGAYSIQVGAYAGSSTYYPYTFLDLGGNVSNPIVFWGNHNGTQVLYVRFETVGNIFWWRSFVECFRTGFSVTQFSYSVSRV